MEQIIAAYIVGTLSGFCFCTLLYEKFGKD